MLLRMWLFPYCLLSTAKESERLRYLASLSSTYFKPTCQENIKEFESHLRSRTISSKCCETVMTNVRVSLNIELLTLARMPIGLKLLLPAKMMQLLHLLKCSSDPWTPKLRRVHPTQECLAYEPSMLMTLPFLLFL